MEIYNMRKRKLPEKVNQLKEIARQIMSKSLFSEFLGFELRISRKKGNGRGYCCPSGRYIAIGTGFWVLNKDFMDAEDQSCKEVAGYPMEGGGVRYSGKRLEEKDETLKRILKEKGIYKRSTNDWNYEERHYKPLDDPEIIRVFIHELVHLAQYYGRSKNKFRGHGKKPWHGKTFKRIHKQFKENYERNFAGESQ